MGEFKGDFTIDDDNQLICKATELMHGDVSLNDQVSLELIFKIVGNDKVQLDSVSEKDTYSNDSIGKTYEKRETEVR